MYMISYSINGHQHEEEFETERDMEDYYIIWVCGEDFDYCMFFGADNREYTPDWM